MKKVIETICIHDPDLAHSIAKRLEEFPTIDGKTLEVVIREYQPDDPKNHHYELMIYEVVLL